MLHSPLMAEMFDQVALSNTHTVGADYAAVTTLAKPKVCDFTDGYFQNVDTVVTEPYLLLVVSPNGGESWRRGSTYPIIWTSGGDPSAAVMVELYKRNSLDNVLSPSTANDGKLNRMVSASQAVGSDYKIKTTSTADGSVYDFTDSVFSIAPP